MGHFWGVVRKCIGEEVELGRSVVMGSWIVQGGEIFSLLVLAKSGSIPDLTTYQRILDSIRAVFKETSTQVANSSWNCELDLCKN